jgi:hypothetical protein
MPRRRVLMWCRPVDSISGLSETGSMVTWISQADAVHTQSAYAPRRRPKLADGRGDHRAGRFTRTPIPNLGAAVSVTMAKAPVGTPSRSATLEAAASSVLLLEPAMKKM